MYSSPVADGIRGETFSKDSSLLLLSMNNSVDLNCEALLVSLHVRSP